jgi:hypothetical protein
MMTIRAHALVLLATLAAACSPPLPTAPDPVRVVATPRQVIALRLMPLEPLYLSGAATIDVAAFGTDGAPISVDVTCVSSAGQLTPASFNTGTVASLQLTGTTMPTRVHCVAGALQADALADLSAWKITVGHYGLEGVAGVDTELLLTPVRRMIGIEPTAIFFDWGDGTVELSPNLPLSSPAYLRHRHRAPGVYNGVARIEWPGGASESRVALVVR